MYAGSGSTTAGGVKSGFLTVLTVLSSVMMKLNIGLIATLNPGMITEGNYEALQAAIQGAVTSVSIIDSHDTLRTSSRNWDAAGRDYTTYSINVEGISTLHNLSGFVYDDNFDAKADLITDVVSSIEAERDIYTLTTEALKSALANVNTNE